MSTTATFGSDTPTLPRIPVVAASNRGLRVYSKVVAWSVFFLIFVGSLVTSNNAGLAVPDWPTSFGQNMFLFPPSQWRGIIFYEHVHRLIASSIGMLTVVLALWTWISERRRWVRVLTACALGVVILQGILGGLTVLFLLPVEVSSAHAVLGQTFFVLTIIIAYSHSRERAELAEKSSAPRRGLLYFAIAAAAAVYCQLIIGAVMRHSGAGLAIPDFPTMGGSWLPLVNQNLVDAVNQMRIPLGLGTVTGWQVGIHLLHRAGAVFVVAMLLAAAIPLARSRRVHSVARATVRPMVLMVFAQFALGVITVLTRRIPWIASAHVTLGAGLLACTVLLALRVGMGEPRSAE